MLPTKPPAFLFSTFTSISATLPSTASSPSSPPLTRPRRKPLRAHLRFSFLSCEYATSAPPPSSSSTRKSSNSSAPPWPTHKHPTPYDIFGHSRTSPYSKQRFYELVKLYHPDRCHLSHHSRPRTVLIERYRLVVAANVILSDPARRKAYDAYGAGWDGVPDLRNDGGMTTAAGVWRHAAAENWRTRPDSPAYNATWEDWEKWYARRDHAEREERRKKAAAAGEGDTFSGQSRHGSGGPEGGGGASFDETWAQRSAPLYASNMAFVSLVVMLAALAGVGQATRAESFGSDLSLKRDLVHMGCSKELSRRRDVTTTRVGGREESVEAFVRERENAAFGFVDDSEGDDHGGEADEGEEKHGTKTS